MPRYRYLLIAASVTLTACGTTPTERGVSGAGIGASAGAIVGAVTGLSVLEGAVLGTVAGGLTGALTNPGQINLGEPLWKQGSGGGYSGSGSRSAAYAYSGNPTVRGIQSGLARLGYDPGPADGIAGARTASAIRAYQQQNGLPVTGRPSPELAAHIQGH